MLDTTVELLDKIRLGEDTSIEFKEVRFNRKGLIDPRRADLSNDLAAMGNTHDGLLILGVCDKTREITGIPPEKLEGVERMVFEICNDLIRPPLIFRSFRLELPDSEGKLRPVLKIEIPRSIFVHESAGGYFFRQGSTIRKMPPEYLARLFQQRSQARLIRFEEQSVPDTTFEDLHPELWKRYVTRSGEDPQKVLLKRNLLAREANGSIRASVAGILMCCSHPEKFHPGAFIQAVRYQGTFQDTDFQLDGLDIHGPLDHQINQAMAFFKRNLVVAARKIPHRVEFPRFSERAVFEAMVNAVAHRDYSISMAKIRFFIFDDRIELYSPGSLPNTVTIESMALRQATRNELITSLLAETPIARGDGESQKGGYMEKRGDGVGIIFHECEKICTRKPLYQLIDDSELLLTLYATDRVASPSI